MTTEAMLLVERLRRTMRGEGFSRLRNPDGPEAADLIESLLAPPAEDDAERVVKQVMEGIQHESEDPHQLVFSWRQTEAAVREALPRPTVDGEVERLRARLELFQLEAASYFVAYMAGAGRDEQHMSEARSAFNEALDRTRAALTENR